jgi:hypothetical protein
LIEQHVELGADEFEPGLAHRGRGAAHEVLHELDVLDELHREIEVEQRHEPAIDRAGVLDAAFLDQPVDRDGLPGEGADLVSDPAAAAEHESLEGEIVEPVRIS